jgi:hypothetical protein
MMTGWPEAHVMIVREMDRRSRLLDRWSERVVASLRLPEPPAAPDLPSAEEAV